MDSHLNYRTVKIRTFHRELELENNTHADNVPCKDSSSKKHHDLQYIGYILIQHNQLDIDRIPYRPAQYTKWFLFECFIFTFEDNLPVEYLHWYPDPDKHPHSPNKYRKMYMDSHLKIIH